MVPVLKEKLSYRGFDLGEVLKAGFEVQWTTMDGDKCRECVDSGGRCGFDYTVNEFACFCSLRRGRDTTTPRKAPRWG